MIKLLASFLLFLWVVTSMAQEKTLETQTKPNVTTNKQAVKIEKDGEKLLTKLCGLTFGDKFPKARVTAKTNNGDYVCPFTPTKKFMMFTNYVSHLSPNTRTLFSIEMWVEFKDKEPLIAYDNLITSFNKVSAVLSSFYNIKPDVLMEGEKAHGFKFNNGTILLVAFGDSFDKSHSLYLSAGVDKYSDLSKREADFNAVKQTDTSALE